MIVGPGSKPLLYGLLMALEGDLILPSPSWVSYAPQARLLHKAVHYIPSEASDDYAFIEAHHPTLEKGLDQFRKLISDLNRQS